MKKLLMLMLLAATMCGCALVYTGNVVTSDNLKAVEVSKALEAEYAKEGLKELTPSMRASPMEQAFYSTEWCGLVESSPRPGSVCVFHNVKDGTLYIYIAPQPRANDASRKVGEGVRAFLTSHYPDLKWQLTGTSEPDVGQ
jgi:hypothetical protein